MNAKGDPLNDKKNEIITPEKAFEDQANAIVKQVPELANHRTTLHGMFQIGFEHGVKSAKRQLDLAAENLRAGNDALNKSYDRMKASKLRNDELLRQLADLTRKKLNIENALHQELKKQDRQGRR